MRRVRSGRRTRQGLELERISLAIRRNFRAVRNVLVWWRQYRARHRLGDLQAMWCSRSAQRLVGGPPHMPKKSIQGRSQRVQGRNRQDPGLPDGIGGPRDEYDSWCNDLAIIPPLSSLRVPDAGCAGRRANNGTSTLSSRTLSFPKCPTMRFCRFLVTGRTYSVPAVLREQRAEESRTGRLPDAGPPRRRTRCVVLRKPEIKTPH